MVTEKEAKAFQKKISELEAKILRSIRRRMRILAKDKKLKEEMEKEIYANLSK